MQNNVSAARFTQAKQGAGKLGLAAADKPAEADNFAGLQLDGDTVNSAAGMQA